MVTEVPIELKTCSNFPKDKKPYEAHRYQLNCYLHALGYDSGYIIYILKDAQEVKTMNCLVEYDSSLQKYINQKVLDFHSELLLINKKEE